MVNCEKIDFKITQLSHPQSMINQLNPNENTQNQFSNAFKELQLGKLLRKANITKNWGIPAYEVFQFLLLCWV